MSASRSAASTVSLTCIGSNSSAWTAPPISSRNAFDCSQSWCHRCPHTTTAVKDQVVGVAYRTHIAAQQLVQVLNRETPRPVVIKHLECSADPLVPLDRLLQQNTQLYRFRASSPHNDLNGNNGWNLQSQHPCTCTSFQSMSAAILRCRQRLYKPFAAPGQPACLRVCCVGKMVTNMQPTNLHSRPPPGA